MKDIKSLSLLATISVVLFFLRCPMLVGEEPHPCRHGELIFAVDIIRHGDRTPTDCIPTAPYTWNEGLGQLTPLGMSQERNLGEKLRNRYIGILLPQSYEAGTMYVRSTEFDRTLMSAQCTLEGLYPPGTGPRLDEDASSLYALPYGFQPIPIHTVSRAIESLLIPDDDHNSATCYNFSDLLKSYVFPSLEWQTKKTELQPYFASWSKATGIQIEGIDPKTGEPIESLYKLRFLGDTLCIHRNNGAPMPPDLSEKDITTIIDAGHWVLTTIFNNPQVAKITGASLLHEIVKYLDNASRTSSEKIGGLPSKYVLFSAHDTTILSQLGALGIPQAETPPFSSNLNISLYNSPNGGHTVTISYNDQELVLPWSGSTESSLEQFKSFVAKF